MRSRVGKTYAGSSSREMSEQFDAYIPDALSSFNVKNNDLSDFDCDRYESIDALGLAEFREQRRSNGLIAIPDGVLDRASMMCSTAFVAPRSALTCNPHGATTRQRRLRCANPSKAHSKQ